MRNKDTAHCAMCGQRRDLTFHHLIPRKLHRRKRFQKNVDRETLNQGIMVCRICHRGLHKTYDEMTLGTQFNTLDAILADDALARHAAWSARQKLSHNQPRKQ